VPARDRAGWLASRAAELFDWWYLVEHGEPVRHGGAALCRAAFADAVAQRFGDRSPLRLVRAPMFVPIAAVVSLIVIALLSRGFSVTRYLVALAAEMRSHPWPDRYDWRGDRIFIYAAPIILALTTGCTLLTIGCLSLRARGWRYWSFLALKAIGVAVLFPLIWIELGTAIRLAFAAKTWHGFFGVASGITLLICMGRGMIWCVADQRRRCRACMRRMILPVRVGSWASQFDPSRTEMLCEHGHGALALSDAETNVQDRWTRLDDSWKALFR
jgi:hypothetical protein